MNYKFFLLVECVGCDDVKDNIAEVGRHRDDVEEHVTQGQKFLRHGRA